MPKEIPLYDDPDELAEAFLSMAPYEHPPGYNEAIDEAESHPDPVTGEDPDLLAALVRARLTGEVGEDWLGPGFLREQYRAQFLADHGIAPERIDSLIEEYENSDSGQSGDVAAEITERLREESHPDPQRDETQSDTWEALKRQSAARKALKEGEGERKPHPSEGWQLSVPTGDAEAMYWEKILGWLGRTAEGMRERRAEWEAEHPSLEARGEALDRQLGPVPEELLLHVPWPPKEGEGTTSPKHEEGDSLPLPAREGYEVDITEHKLPGGALGYVRTKKETPSERAARIAFLEAQKDTD